MGLIIFLCVTVLAIGVWEKRRHNYRLHTIPLRVNINGIRGKSTVTRLITGILQEAGYRVVGKTTGTSPRMIYWNSDEEKHIVRRPEGANIREQKMVINESFKLGANALVCECMAVNPDYQITFQKEFLQANIYVIVNVLEDHMEVMGPTLERVAEAFAASIPEHGKLILIDDQFLPYFTAIAEKKGTEVIVADGAAVTDAQLAQFKYILFPDNAALALAVAKGLNIPEDVAWRGMLLAHPDPGVLQISPIGDGENPGYFVNGFAANDVTSTLNIFHRVVSIGYSAAEAMAIMYCRADRVDRTIQFAEEFFSAIPFKYIVLVGKTFGPIKEAHHAGKYPGAELMEFEDTAMDLVYEEIAPLLAGRMVFGVGNIKGVEPLIDLITKVKDADIAEKGGEAA